MNNLTKLIKEKNSLKLMRFIDYVPAFIANVFSVVFSTSIILELKGIVNSSVLVLLSVFIVLFLIQNEIIKVKEIRKLFAGSKNALLPFTITFIISISLASIGMYFYTNKAGDIRELSEINKSIEINRIDQSYQTKFSEIQISSFETTDEYKNINTELLYWKRAGAANITERTDIRNKIENLQKIINDGRNKFEANKALQIKQLENLANNEKQIIGAKYNSTKNKTDKNNFISYIFLSLILITEFSTIVLNRNVVEKENLVKQFTNSKIAKTYLISSNLLTALYMSVKDGWVNINNAKYSYANKDNYLEWDEIKTIYNNFISLKILSTGEVRSEGMKELLHNEILMTEVEAQKKLDEYFERYLNIG